MEIKARSRLLGAGPNVGALTALHRDEWSALFPMLNEYGLNTESVKAMTTAVSHLDVVFIGLESVCNLPKRTHLESHALRLTSSLTPCSCARSAWTRAATAALRPIVVGPFTTVTAAGEAILARHCYA